MRGCLHKGQLTMQVAGDNRRKQPSRRELSANRTRDARRKNKSKLRIGAGAGAGAGVGVRIGIGIFRTPRTRTADWPGEGTSMCFRIFKKLAGQAGGLVGKHWPVAAKQGLPPANCLGCCPARPSALHGAAHIISIIPCIIIIMRRHKLAHVMGLRETRPERCGDAYTRDVCDNYMLYSSNY
ncbi:hypothetical protein BGW36DRAFT_47284 [Talaromyces proteolyticus]|uniref:Uncharacterized protein n=1 Tax=Talaromyces proteolyticus TaxID=1131652 RepID=A0AAD4PTM6_9EURO|nr:uncharacterized protein BGW36DRAFT_47284 [Talaromyces proteolyticus]KAH8691115.1 hypothetical protein BGW36DRAFT_47284 [Talaromyces proteolyticus]